MMPDRARWGDIEGKPLSPREHRALSAYARLGRRKDAAALLGVSDNTVSAYLSRAYTKLGVEGAIEAFTALGWLVPA